jgi:rsbT co-antagonist protein RsbR
MAEDLGQLQERLKEVEQRLESREKELLEVKARMEYFEVAFREMADAVMLVDGNGKMVVFNALAERITGMGATNTSPKEWSKAYGLFHTDKVTPFAFGTSPTTRALKGETVVDVEMFVRNAHLEDGAFITTSSSPLRRADGTVFGAVTLFRDITARKATEDELAAKRAELEASEKSKTAALEELQKQLRTVDYQRLAIRELSTPVLELWDDVLALPLIGVIDSARSAQIMERLLEEVVHKQSRFVILDITGVEVIDTEIANHFLKLVRAVELMGAQCLLTGVRPAVAHSLVDLGIDLGKVRTHRNLRHGLRECLRHVQSKTSRAGGETGAPNGTATRG